MSLLQSTKIELISGTVHQVNEAYIRFIRSVPPETNYLSSEVIPLPTSPNAPYPQIVLKIVYLT